MEELMLYFAGVYGARYTNRQKFAFASYLVKQLEKQECSPKLLGGGLKKGEPAAILCGDLDRANIILAAPYDTCSKAFLPGYRYYPFSKKKSEEQNRLNGLVELFLMAVFVLLCALVLYKTGVELNFSSFRTFLTLACVGVLGLLTGAVAKGVSNRQNLNRNTASVMLLYTLALELKENKKAAFVFCDRACLNGEGYGFLARACENKGRKNFLILDCVGYGDAVWAVHKAEEKERAHKLAASPYSGEIKALELSKEAWQDTAVSCFPRAVLLCSGQMQDNELVVSYTRGKRDGIVDLDRLEELKKVLAEYIRKETE